MHKGRVAIVTGATRGIGKAIALELAKNGANIVLNYRNRNGVDALIEEIRSFGVEALAVPCDVTDAASVELLIKTTIEQFNKIDILVNNAGITRDNLVYKMTEDDFDTVIDTNLKGAFLTTKQVYRQMLKQKYGRIINISSVVGLHGNMGQANYAASKAGLLGLTKSVALEVANKNVTVNAICPGFIKTDMTESLNESVSEAILKEIPMRRFAEAIEVAKLVSFLSSEDAGYITGAVIPIDGGMGI